MGVAMGAPGPWSPKYLASTVFQFYKKAALRLNERADVIETKILY